MIDPKWLDKNGLVKPRLSMEDSGNGALYSAMYLALSARVTGIDDKDYIQFTEAVAKCMKEPGLLLRTPDNKYGQESHDNNLGWAVGEAVMGNRDFVQNFIQYGTKNNFFFDTDGKFSFADFLGRFPHEVLLMHEMAYPSQSPLVFSLLKKAADMMPFDPENASGFHLAWMFHVGCFIMGVTDTRINDYELKLRETTPKYFDEGHPIIDLATRLEPLAPRKPVTSESPSA